MTIIRMTRLDPDGNPTGETSCVMVSNFLYTPNECDFTDGSLPCLDQDLMVALSKPVSFTVNLRPESYVIRGLYRMLFGAPNLKQRRAARHRARVTPTPRRKNKHGRTGVYR